MTTSHLNYCNTLLINFSTSRFTFKFSHTAPSAVFLKFRSHEVMVLSKTLPRVTAVCLLVAQLCPTLCNPMYCSLPRSSVHVISQARILEWVAISFSRGSSRSGIDTASSASPALEGGFFTTVPPGLHCLNSRRRTWHTLANGCRQLTRCSHR